MKAQTVHISIQCTSVYSIHQYTSHSYGCCHDTVSPHGRKAPHARGIHYRPHNEISPQSFSCACAGNIVTHVRVSTSTACIPATEDLCIHTEMKALIVTSN